jgi:hypothetical protein
MVKRSLLIFKQSKKLSKRTLKARGLALSGMFGYDIEIVSEQILQN